MSISAVMVKDLRTQSGAGIMECKDALKESNGDLDAALELLRKKGTVKAAKKADRSTKEGAIGGLVEGGKAAIIEIKCETDFVARNDKFQELCGNLASHVLKTGAVDTADELLGQPLVNDASKTVKDLMTEKIHELGENLVLGRTAMYELDGAGGFGLYIHGAGSIGVLVEVTCSDEKAAEKERFTDVCRDLAMHIAAAAPIAVTQADVPADTVAKEKEIFTAQAKESGKPDKIIPKIIEGRVKKYFTEIVLLEQAFVKDPDLSISEFLADASRNLGADISVKRFTRLQLGE
ncbi:Translation elongation factor Ts [hydrothermal vent metagenome]|uniref:Translation elongation factor Ts n=1 Tax=hydrothermal vent metagenome TaxID=652676 RepID=A0A3B1BJ32_9ZZZZ